MDERVNFVELRICLSEPAELTALVGAFSAIGNQFDEYIRREHRNLKGAAKLVVKDLRKGSIIVELMPLVMPLVATMDTALIVDGFVTRYGGLLNRYLAGERDPEAPKSTINDLLGQVAIIANDPEGKSAISSVQYHETKATKKLSIEFDTSGAKRAKETLQIQKATLDLAAYELLENKLLVFEQTSVRASETGKRTNLKGRIETVHFKPLAVVFETDLARERIESEIREDERNVYKKGFIVDCYAERVGGKPVAYRITTVRHIIPLPDDDPPLDA